MALMDRIDIEHLAKLAKLQLTAEELTAYEKEIAAILGYVAQVNAVAGDAPAILESAGVRNVLREDGEPVATGTYTDTLVGAAPASQDGFIKVQKILDTTNGA